MESVRFFAGGRDRELEAGHELVPGRALMPGRALAPDEAPRLWNAAREVAERIGTRPVDSIHLTPGTGIAAAERGGLRRKLRGAAERRLVLGLGTLAGMSEPQLKAILAHEYCHFLPRDAIAGKAAGIMRPFGRLARAASRRRELRADRRAAAAYGARTLSSALTHVVRRSLIFGEQVKWEMESALREERPLANVYRLPPLPPGELLERVDALEREHMKRTTGSHDSHPAFGERLAMLEKIAAKENGAVSTDAGVDAEALFDRIDALHAEMTAAVEESVRRHQG